MGGGDGDKLKCVVIESLYREWGVFVKTMRKSIIFRKRDLSEESERVVRFGNESVKLGLQTYKSVNLSLLLVNTLFGIDYEGILLSEMKARSAKRVMFHVGSRERIGRLFNVGGLSGINHRHEGIEKSICGKVQLVGIDENDSEVGFILDEVEGQWEVQLSGNKIIWFPVLEWDNDRKLYIYNTVDYFEGLRIEEYHPIRIMISANGTIQMTFNKISILTNNKILHG